VLLFTGTKVHLFSLFSSIFGNFPLSEENTPFFNISYLSDYQTFAKKLQKKAKKNRKK